MALTPGKIIALVGLIVGLLSLLPRCAPAQPMPPPDINIQLNVCHQTRDRFIFDAETATTYLNQFIAELGTKAKEVADLQKKLAEAEAKVPPYPIDPNISD